MVGTYNGSLQQHKTIERVIELNMIQLNNVNDENN